MCRVLRLLVRHAALQVWETHVEACKTSSGTRPAETERVEQWRRLRSLLAHAALTACSMRGAGAPHRRCIACAELFLSFLPSPPDATHVEWPPDASPQDRALLCDARVVAADSSGGLEFPHRSIQEYFCAIAVHLELAKAPAPADSHAEAATDRVSSRTAYDTCVTWNDAKLPGVPRDAILTVLLSDAAADDLKKWALTSTDWGHKAIYERRYELGDVRACVSVADVGSSPPSDAVCRAMSDPANDVLRHMTMALLYRPAPGTCDRIVSALAAGCEAATFCDFLGVCAPLLPSGCAAKLIVGGLFNKAVSVFWGLGATASVDTVQMLGHKFWSAVDATTGGALIDRALTTLRSALPPSCPGNPSDDTVACACIAAAIVGSVSHMSTPEALAEVHSVIALAASSSIDSLASEATFASTVLEPLPGSTAAVEGIRDRLLILVRSAPSRGAATPTVHRASAELARRFAGDSVVHAALKADAKPLRGGRMTPFVEACVRGPGTALISSEIACTLFAWLEPADCTRLAIRLWDAREDSEEAVAAGLTPLHIAASRARTDFIAVYLGQESLDVATVVNTMSGGGCTPLDVCGSRAEGDLDAVVECALALVAAGARWSRPREGAANALHVAIKIGSGDALSRLLAVPVGASPEVVDAQDKVRTDEWGSLAPLCAPVS